MIIEFLKKLFGIKSEKVEYPVIIPDHRKEIMKKEDRKNQVQELKEEYKKEGLKTVKKKIDKKLIDKKIKDIDLDKEVSLFEVEGVYSLHEMALITGFVEVGRLKNGMKAIKNEVQFKITEIRKSNEKVPSLLTGEKGTITISAKKNPMLRQGDYLEFE